MSHPYIQITWRACGGWYRAGWRHERKWNPDTHHPDHILLHTTVPKKIYPDYPDGLPSHRRVIDLYPEFKKPAEVTMDHDYIDVAGTYKYHTANALLVEVAENDSRWIPRSQLDLEDVDLDDFREDQMATFRVKAWWAQREGLI